MADQADPAVKMADIAMELRTDIQNKIFNYAVPLFANDDTFGQGKDEFVGSGTLVAVGNHPFVLTAAHVWARLKQFATLSILLDAEGKAFSTPVDAVNAFDPYKRRHDAWGPDLALLGLPNAVFALAKDRRVFFNLGRRLADALTSSADTERGLWAVAGAPAEWIKAGVPYSILSFNTFFSGVDRTHERDGHDYIDLGFNHKGRPDLPSSYKGVSGAGLWQIPLARSKSTGKIVWDDRVLLEGVAFYEKFEPDGRGFIRCHGRKSIYRTVERLNDPGHR